jgi:hypothetical protein
MDIFRDREVVNGDLHRPYPYLRCKFLRGPIPCWWLVKAARLPGKALHLAAVLWQRKGVVRSNHVTLSARSMSELGVKWDAVRRALKHMENAGLVRVGRTVGRSPRVEIVTSEPEASETKTKK